MRFRFAWAMFSTALRYSSFTGRRFVVPSTGPQAATHVTLVARLPSHVTASIKQAVTSLGESAPNHHFYPANTVHLTIQNLDRVVRGVDSLERVREQLRAVVGSFPPTRMMVAGLGVSPDSVFVQIFPVDETLANLRREINTMILRDRPSSQEAVAREAIPSSHPVRWLFRHMAFANVVRFAGKVEPSFIREIARHRSRYFGEFVLQTLELVVTDRLLSCEGTQVRDRIQLRAQPQYGSEKTGSRIDMDIG
jgi:hypothetical protein